MSSRSTEPMVGRGWQTAGARSQWCVAAAAELVACSGHGGACMVLSVGPPQSTEPGVVALIRPPRAGLQLLAFLETNRNIEKGVHIGS